MNVTAGAELRKEAEPLWGFHTRVERGEERVVQHRQYLHLHPSSPFLAPARELPLIHDFGRERRKRGVIGGRRRRAFELGEVDGADVTGAEALEEPEVREGEMQAESAVRPGGDGRE